MEFPNKIGYSCHTFPGKPNILMVNTRNDVVILDVTDLRNINVKAVSDLSEIKVT